MKLKWYYTTVATIFTVLAIVHAARVYVGWEFVMGGVNFPIWISWVAAILAAYLAVRGFQFANRYEDSDATMTKEV